MRDDAEATRTTRSILIAAWLSVGFFGALGFIIFADELPATFSSGLSSPPRPPMPPAASAGGDPWTSGDAHASRNMGDAWQMRSSVTPTSGRPHNAQPHRSANERDAMNHAMGSRTALSRSCSHKRLAFVGDSTMQEVMFTLMLEVMCNGGNHACAPLDPFTLPVQHCANTRCMTMARRTMLQDMKKQLNDTRGNHSSTALQFEALQNKAASRCFSMSACDADGRSAMQAARMPFVADFIWSGNDGIISNGGGLARSFGGGAHWHAYFVDVVHGTNASSPMSHAHRNPSVSGTHFPFDAVLFTSGLHDAFHNPQLRQRGPAYDSVLATYSRNLALALHQLSALAPTRIFLSLARRPGSRWAHPPLREIGGTIHHDVLRNVSAELVRRGAGGGWISAEEVGSRAYGDHCGSAQYDGTGYGVGDTANCTALAQCVGRMLCDADTAAMASAGHAEVACRCDGNVRPTPNALFR